MKTSKQAIRGRETERKAIALRKKGYTYEQIAGALQITEMGALKAVRRAIKRIVEHADMDADRVRALEIERLDAMLKAIWAVVSGEVCDDNPKGEVSLKAINTALNIMKRRAELLGLDAPKKVEVEDVTGIDEQIAGILARFKPASQVQVAVEINSPRKSIDAPGNVVQLDLPSGARVG